MKISGCGLKIYGPNSGQDLLPSVLFHGTIRCYIRLWHNDRHANNIHGGHFDLDTLMFLFKGLCDQVTFELV